MTGATILVDRREGEDEVDITVVHAEEGPREKVTVPPEPEEPGEDDSPDASAE